MEKLKDKIIEYIAQNRVSTTEVADCMNKTGAVESVMPLNSRHFAVGEILYLYAVDESNWTIHEELEKYSPTNKIIFIDAIDVNGRAVIGDIVSKYIILYQTNKAIVTNGKMRDAHTLIKENYPIWCNGVTPIGCFNRPVDREKYETDIKEHRAFYEGAIAVCDDSGVVIIPKKLHTEEFYKKLEEIELQEDIWYDCIDRRKWSTFRTICKKEYLKQ